MIEEGLLKGLHRLLEVDLMDLNETGIHSAQAASQIRGFKDAGVMEKKAIAVRTAQSSSR